MWVCRNAHPHFFVRITRINGGNQNPLLRGEGVCDIYPRKWFLTHPSPPSFRALNSPHSARGCVKMNFLYQYVILNGVKNLNTSTYAFQILREAQDDTTK